MFLTYLVSGKRASASNILPVLQTESWKTVVVPFAKAIETGDITAADKFYNMWISTDGEPPSADVMTTLEGLMVAWTTSPTPKKMGVTCVERPQHVRSATVVPTAAAAPPSKLYEQCR
jgi:hypothetical protein